LSKNFYYCYSVDWFCNLVTGASVGSKMCIIAFFGKTLCHLITRTNETFNFTYAYAEKKFLNIFLHHYCKHLLPANTAACNVL